MKKSKTPRKKNSQGALEELAERMNDALDDLGIAKLGEGRQVQAARLFGVTDRACRRWLSGTGYPSQSEYQTIADMLQVRVEWLFFGLGPKSQSLITGSKQDQIVTVLDTLLDNAINENKIKLSQKSRKAIALTLSRQITKLKIR